jgi:hypothetical protein
MRVSERIDIPAKANTVANSAMNPKVDDYLAQLKQWQDELTHMRRIALGSGLTEEIKWGQPCYMFGKTNVVILQGFKKYCAFLFFKGVLMDDPNGILVKTGENTEVGRQIRFNSVAEILEIEDVLKAYILHAADIEKSGAKLAPKPKSDLSLPGEFQRRLSDTPALQAAFDSLTPGRQRAYSFYFSEPKQTTTREARIEKCVQRILAGKGLNDR